MAYISRNSDGDITAIFEAIQPDAQEYLSVENPELIQFISQVTNDDNVKAILSSSDVA